MKRVLGFVVAAAALTSTAAADVAYDSITNFNAPLTQQFSVVPIQADDITLDAAAGLTLTRVELLTRLRSMASFAEFNGTLTVRIYAGGGFSPGAQLAEAARPLVVPRGTDLLAAVDFPGISLPTQSFFVGWFFTMPGQINVYNDMWVRQNLAAPAPGSTNSFFYASNDTQPPFFTATTADNRNYALRVTTIPAPPAAAALACAFLAVPRRRVRHSL